jgi:hypothetical protein
MSQLFKIDEYVFHNRKPSKKQIMGCIVNSIGNGNKAISVSWGENCLDINYNTHHEYNRMGTWYGSGWIKNISGDDIARELNKKGYDNGIR